MSQKILVTGGAGYLGSVLCEHLLDRGYAVTVLDNLLYQQNSLFHLCARPQFDFMRGDARDEAVLRPLVRQADVIIPLAAIVGAPACDRDPISATSVNLEAVRLLNRIRGRQQLVVYPNTNSGYGTKSGASTARKICRSSRSRSTAGPRCRRRWRCSRLPIRSHFGWPRFSARRRACAVTCS